MIVFGIFIIKNIKVREKFNLVNIYPIFDQFKKLNNRNPTRKKRLSLLDKAQIF